MEKTSPNQLTLAELSILARENQRQLETLAARRQKRWSWRLPAGAIALLAVALTVGGAVYASVPVTANVVKGCYNLKTMAVSLAPSGKCSKGTAALAWDQYTQIAANAPLSVTPGANGKAPAVGLTGVVPVANGGTGSASKNFVDLNSSQIVGGPKTFSSPIGGSITGNAATVTNGLYSTGSYDDPGWLTALSGTKITGPVASATTSQNFTGGLSGDVTGTQKATTVGALQGTALSPQPPVPGQSLIYDGTSWAPQGVYNPLQVAELRWYSANQTGDSFGFTAPSAMAFDGTHMWVVSQGGSVSEVDAATHQVLNTVTVGSQPQGAVFDGSHVWVSNLASGTVSEIDVATHSVINTVTVGPDPQWLAFDGSHIWVSNTGGRTLSEISDGASPTVINTVTLPSYESGVEGIAFDGTNIWAVAGTPGWINEISDGATPSVVISQYMACGDPYGLAFDGRFLWATCASDGTVKRFDPARLWATPNPLPVGSEPEGIAFDGSHIWVSSFDANSVTEIDDASYRIMNTVTVGTWPRAVAFDGSNIWAGNWGANTMSIL